MEIITTVKGIEKALSGVIPASVLADALAGGMLERDALIFDLCIRLAKGLTEDKTDAANLGRMMSLLRDELNDALKAENRPRKVKTPQIGW